MNEQVNQASMESLKPTSNTQLALPSSGTDIGVAASAAQGKAMVEARYVMAMRQPRNMDQARVDILHECRRPSFANNKSAYYVKPIGDGAEGLGIRFAEVAIRCMKNILIESPMVFEDADMELHRVIVTDLESNATYSTDVRVSKLVERRKLQPEQQSFGSRRNSYGDKVFLVRGSDDDLLNKRAALISKAIRTLALRIVPGDIQDEAEAIIKRIRIDKVNDDPDGARKAIADGFAELNVSVESLVGYLGHPLSGCSPAELVKLRGVYGAIRDGELTWQEVLANADDNRKAAPASKGEAAARQRMEQAGAPTGPATGTATGGSTVEGAGKQEVTLESNATADATATVATVATEATEAKPARRRRVADVE